MASILLKQTSPAARGAIFQSSRTLSTSSMARRDLVQDLYVREIKAYKTPIPAKDAHVGSVKAFSRPVVPQSPSLPAELAAELASYDAAEPGSPAAPAQSSMAGEPAGGAKEYLAFLEQELPPEEAHH